MTVSFQRINWEACSRQLPIEAQQHLAVKHPKSFIDAVKHEQGIIVHAKDRVRNPNSLVQIWAFATLNQPFYKTEVCANPSLHYDCQYGHPGDLMRVRTQMMLPEFYIYRGPSPAASPNLMERNVKPMALSSEKIHRVETPMAERPIPTSYSPSPQYWQGPGVPRSFAPLSAYDAEQIHLQKMAASKAAAFYAQAGMRLPFTGISPVPTGLTPPNTPPLPSPRRTPPPPPSPEPSPRPSPVPPAVAQTRSGTFRAIPMEMLSRFQGQSFVPPRSPMPPQFTNYPPQMRVADGRPPVPTQPLESRVTVGVPGTTQSAGPFARTLQPGPFFPGRPGLPLSGRATPMAPFPCQCPDCYRPSVPPGYPHFVDTPRGSVSDGSATPGSVDSSRSASPAQPRISPSGLRADAPPFIPQQEAQQEASIEDDVVDAQPDPLDQDVEALTEAADQDAELEAEVEQEDPMVSLIGTGDSIINFLNLDDSTH